MLPFPPPFDSPALVVSTVVAVSFGFLIWMIIAFTVVWYVNKRVARISAEGNDAGGHDANGTMGFVYWLSVLFWPLALIMGITYMLKPETARAGRICLLILLGTLNGCVVFGMAGAVVLIYFFPPV